MAIDDLNKVYDEILGAGEPLVEEEGSTGAGQSPVDGAYVQDDYLDDAGDGTDPRDDVLDDSDEEKTDDDDVDVMDDEKDDDTDDDYIEIPQRLVDAGRQANLSDEVIEELAESRPEVLEAMARSFEAAQSATQRQRQESGDSRERDRQKPEEDVRGFKPLKIDFDEDDIEELGPKAMGIINKLTDTVNQLGEQVNVQSQSIGNVERQGEIEKIRSIDSHFDSLSEEIQELGTSSNLTDEQKRNRVFAFNVARAAMTTYGVSDEREALTIGAKALLAQKKDSQVKEQLIRDLDRNKKRFISRGRNRQRPAPKRSMEERALAAIDKVLDSPDY